MSDDCVLLIGHGSREPASNAEFEAIASAYRLARPELRVETAYVELARPLIAEATSFSKGEALFAGPIVARPTRAAFEGRLSPEGGGDVPTDWAR